MIFDQSKKESTSIIIIHVSITMHGEILIQIDNTADGVTINWFAMADGGFIVDEGEETFPAYVFSEITDEVFRVNYPNQENESASICWEIQCGNNSGEQIAAIEFGFWDIEALHDIIIKLKTHFNGSNAIQFLQDFVNA